MADLHSSTVDSEMLKNTRAPAHRHSSSNVSQKTAFPRWNQKGKEKSTAARIVTWIIQHQISISLTLLSALYLTHTLNPSIHNYTRKFFQISYYNASTGTFALGWDDIFFVFHWIVVFTGLRCIFMDHILSPLAETCGLKKRKEKTRFAEQAWMLAYYTVSWCSGFYIIYHSDYFFNLRAMWQNWPIREMDGVSKTYYLVQFAFWLQQIVVVNIEERRKDHWQMFSHHLITCALIFGSYGYHWSRVGTVIICLMDVVDILLPLAKILKYTKFQLACDITFGVFIVAWLITRHILFMLVVWSAYVHTQQEIQFGCYRGSGTNLTGPTPVPNDWKHVVEPFMNPEGSVCFNRNILFTFVSLLLALQGILLFWFVLIVRVAYKVITGQGADDVRSDDEESIEDEEDELKVEMNGNGNANGFATEAKPHFEKDVLSTDPNFTSAQHPTRQSSTSRSPMGRSLRRKPDGHSSGVNLLAGSDRKELLGRIGCDKGAD